MKERLLRFFPKFLIYVTVVVFSSCGIENYIYLAPVSPPNQTSQDEIPVILPNGDQPDIFFSGYSIYYKIYTSTTQPPTTVITSSNFKDINETMASDYSKIAPYLSADAVYSINMDAFFSGLNYYPLNIKDGTIVSLLNGTNSFFSLQKTNEFVININSASYPLVRSVPNRPPFVYSSEIAGNDVNLIDSHTSAYALFFIFAFGVDEYGASIFSRPTMLGVLQLPNQL